MKARCLEVLSIYLGMTVILGSVPAHSANLTTTSQVNIEVKEEINMNSVFEERMEEYDKMLKEVEKRKEEEARKLEEERLRKEAEAKQKVIDDLCYFDTNDLSAPSGISVQKAYELLKDTSYQTWDMANLLVQGEKREYPVNAIFMISLTRHESWHGKSELAKEKNNISSMKNGRGDWRYFDSKLECMRATIDLISNEYLNPEGLFYNGTSIDEVGIYYCEGNIWSGLIQEMMHYVTDNYNV